jgi:4,5-DOPA dioxygenase extradiol
MAQFPALFISHGSPTILFDPTPSHHFLKSLGKQLEADLGMRPKAIVVATAHWETKEVSVSGVAKPDTIHDFFGFPQALFDAQYPAPGEPALAETVAESLRQAGIPVTVNAKRGLDHGTWIPLALMYPEADIPVVQVSVQPHKSPTHHRQVGEALRGLREQGILVIGSGALTHNLREVRWHDAGNAPVAWAEGFGDWVLERVTSGRFDEIEQAWASAPSALRNHPSTDHLWPLFVAMGAATPGQPGQVAHKGTELGVLRMDTFAFA